MRACHYYGFYFDLQDTTPLGGTGKLLSGFVEDWVNPFENLLYTKLTQAKAIRKTYLEEKRKVSRISEDFGFSKISGLSFLNGSLR